MDLIQNSSCSGIVAAVCIGNNFCALNSRSAVNSLVMDQSIQYICCLNLSSILLFFYLHADSIPSAWIFCYWSSSHSRGKTGSFPPLEGEKKEYFTLQCKVHVLMTILLWFFEGARYCRCEHYSWWRNYCKNNCRRCLCVK